MITRAPIVQALPGAAYVRVNKDNATVFETTIIAWQMDLGPSPITVLGVQSLVGPVGIRQDNVWYLPLLGLTFDSQVEFTNYVKDNNL